MNSNLDNTSNDTKQLIKVSVCIPEKEDMNNSLQSISNSNLTKNRGVYMQTRNPRIEISEIEDWLTLNYNIKKNSITRAYELNGKELEDQDFNTIFIAAKKQFENITKDLLETLIYSDFTKTYNPIKEYLEGVVWDNVDRITPLCQSITSDTGYFDYRRILLQSWLLGIIEAIYLGKPNVLQLILAGLQNTGKSVFFQKLFPAPLLNYVAFSQLDKGKDDELLMCQKVLIIDDEFSGKSKLDAKLVKRLLSAPSFNLREPYGKRNITLNRIATLCATTNETEILNDSTGNRRNIVFEITGKFDFALYNSIDKEQLFAQLVAMHKLGFLAELNQPMINLIEKHTASKHGEVSIEKDCIRDYFEDPESACQLDFMTTTQVKIFIERETNQKLSLKKLGQELKAAGYKKTQKKGTGLGYLILQKKTDYYNKNNS